MPFWFLKHYCQGIRRNYECSEPKKGGGGHKHYIGLNVFKGGV